MPGYPQLVPSGQSYGFDHIGLASEAALQGVIPCHSSVPSVGIEPGE